jgi:hypothetical protein
MSFASRNNLPVRLQDQMISHLSLKFRTDSEGLQQQETLDVLPKAIRSSISHHLFFDLVHNVYLFHGVSNDLLFQLVCLSLFLFDKLALYLYCSNLKELPEMVSINSHALLFLIIKNGMRTNGINVHTNLKVIFYFERERDESSSQISFCAYGSLNP